MPASLNKVFLIGNLTRDPELRYIPSGQAVTSFTVATNWAYNSPSGEKKEEVSFVRVVTWGRRAEVCNEYLRKGSPVFVEGRLQSRSWEAQDGSKRSSLEVVASNVQFLGRGAAALTETPAGVVGEEVVASTAPAEGKQANLTGEGVSISEEELAPDNEVPF